MAKKSKKQKAAEASPASKAGGRHAKGAKTSRANKTVVEKKGKGTGGADIAAVAKKVRAKAADLASNPLVSEVVAATLVAAAAAIKDPKKARAIAASVGDELGKAAKGAESGAAMWQLAMDVAKRSIGALSNGDAAGKSKPKGKKKT